MMTFPISIAIESMYCIYNNIMYTIERKLTVLCVVYLSGCGFN